MTETKVGTLGKKIIEVHRILDYVKAIPASTPKSIAEVYSDLRDKISNETQVSSTLQYYHKKGEVYRMREGHSHYYWGKPASATPSNASPAGLSPEPIGPTHELTPIGKTQHTARPEIRVEANRIVIEHAKCRVIVELL